MLKTIEFWVAVLVAVVVKIKSSQRLGPWQVVTTIAVAVGAAWVGSGFVAHKLDIPEPVSAALIALTAEGLMRWVLIALENPAEVIRLWREWRK